jgi:hypothetical protein
MSAEPPDLSIGPQGLITPPTKVTYNGHRIDIVQPDADHFIASYWQIKIDGILRGNLLFSSARRAVEQAKRLIDGRLE